MSQLIIRGARIEKIEFYCATNGQATTEATMRANWSEAVCEEMGWTSEPLGFGNGSLDGKLYGINMIMEPNKAGLKDYRFDIAISKVDKFKHIANVKDGEVHSRELSFVITTVAEDAITVMSEYVKHCGPGDDRGQCRVTYNAEEQQKLEDAAPEAEEKVRGRRKAESAVQ